ncbi:MAG: RNA polymerase factor sigma-54 [Clostridia bacterium]|nr:RNA polymerase factor sigma-54 [Clostridia bacterium]
MQMGFELNLQQTQKLIMTPELRQAITVLQLSSLELAEFVQEQILENPALEIESAEDSPEETLAAAKEKKEEKEDNEAFDVDWHEYFQDRDIGYVKAPREEAKEINYDNFLTKAPTLEEYLLNQLKLFCCSAKEKEIAQFIIGSLDRNGYLCISLKEIVEMYSYEMSQVEAALKLVQSFDPPGVAARDLVECLLLQISDKELKLNSLLTSVIKYHLEDVAAGRLLKIAKSLDITPEEVQQLVDYIKTLDPKPGRWFADSEQTTYIVPDVVVEKVEGEYIVIVNDVYTPRLGINPVYRRLLSADTVDVNAKKFIEGKLNSAAWIIKSIEQRRLTLYKVVNCIVEFQKNFLDKGVKHLKPLNLKQIAEQLEIHESTVSRATNNKYIQTPQGVFPLKFFFASGVDNYSGSGVSSESIKKMLKEYVTNENSAKPYTDQQLTNMLKAQGIKISRRTVAKYRCELGMASTSKRKRY